MTIANGIADAEELAQEICDTEEYHTALAEKIAYVREFLSRRHSHPPVSTSPSRPSPPAVIATSRESGVIEITSDADTSRTETLPEEVDTHTETLIDRTSADTRTTADRTMHASSTVTVSDSMHRTTDTPHQNISRLPKLNLPYFSGDPLVWQTFWDSFEAAIHSNPSLTGVQKFNYLRAQLQGDAARVIAGFPLTNSNYEHSVVLLRQRFGQSYKLVNAHMQALLNLPNPSNNHSSLQIFYDTIENHMRGLASLGKSPDTYGSLLTPIILTKLPNEIKKNLARQNTNSEWTLKVLMDNILRELQVFETSFHNGGNSSLPMLTPTASFYTGARGQSNRPTGQAERKRAICVFCKGPHSSNACTVITKVEDRMAIVKENRLCFNCLARHKISQCNSKFRCRNCGRKHHTSLCTGTPPAAAAAGPQNKAETEQKNESDKRGENSKAVLTSLTSTKPPCHLSKSCLLKTAIAPVIYKQISIEGNILFDEGSQRSFISMELANKLNLQPQTRENVSLTSFGADSPSRRSLDVATVAIQTITGEKINISVLIVPTIALPLQNPLRASIKEFPHLKGLPLAYPISENENFEISILIGADYYWHFVQDHVVRGDGPTAVQSKLGYLLSGPLPAQTQCNLISLHVTTTTSHEACDLEKFWQIESSDISTSTKDNTDKCFLKSYVNSCVNSKPDGSYSLKFPWRPDHPPLPSNYTTCEKRTRGLARRLADNPHLLQTYGKIISDHLKRGFIEKVTTSPSDTAHYIPHHPVKKQSSTTPIRIVFNCSCRSSQSQPSLNDCLITGPPFLNDMCSILIRFRLHRYGLSTDIEKAFLHVNLDEADRDFTRFLWLSDYMDPESEFQTYRFRVVLFGSVSSPFMLYAAIHYHLSRHPSSVAEDMQSNLYVDNVISGGNSEEEVVSYYKKSRALMSQANFNLRSWASNGIQLQNLAKQDGTAETSNIVKVLVLQWNTSSDQLSLTPRNITTTTPFITKRDVLRDSSSIFDPLGLITPVTIQAKIFLQELWGKNLQWDEPLDDELKNKWNILSRNIQSATSHTSVPRRYSQCTTSSPVALHIFADASTKAYGAVAYLVHQNKQVAFIMSKTRVAPLKPLTLPRLELSAAVLAARLGDFIVRSIQHTSSFQLNTHLWSDSQIVLHWISSNKKLKQFVLHRVNEITTLFPATLWRYCPTSQNPADLLTRGIDSHELASSSLWKFGPPWLPLETQWPVWNLTEIQATTLTVDDANPKSSTPMAKDNTGLSQLINIANHSNLTKLLRITAFTLRFIRNCQKPKIKFTGPITPAELTQANLLWIREIQQESFATEMNNLNAHTTRPQTNRLPLVRQLRLFLDKSGLLRCGGRIHNAPTTELAKFPYLLPTKHPFTKLLVYATHKKQLHGGVNSTLTAIRQCYWIPQVIRKLLRHCVICQKVQGKAYQIPDPPPLIKERIQSAQPFEYTGVDFTGAMYVRDRGHENKVYVCLFTCAVSRAVHLEIVTDLSVETFLQAFRRFSSRKSLPKILISDNASTYMAAAEELLSLFQSTLLTETLNSKGVTWKFIPKRAPWYGGFWERLIGLTKAALKKVLGRTFATLPSLQTIIVEVEAILNDRPITYIPSDVNDPEPLTPAHLLYGRRITSLPHPMVEDDELVDPNYGQSDGSDLRRRAKMQAVILKQFWKRWKLEYLTSLREFHKTTGNNMQQVHIGDVVLVHDDTPRINWQMAVIEDVVRGSDGLIRAAYIRTKNGRTNRPLARLYPLEVCRTEGLMVPEDPETKDPDQEVVQEQPESVVRPTRKTAVRACDKLRNWLEILRAPPEDVEN